MLKANLTNMLLTMPNSQEIALVSIFCEDLVLKTGLVGGFKVLLGVAFKLSE